MLTDQVGNTPETGNSRANQFITCGFCWSRGLGSVKGPLGRGHLAETGEMKDRKHHSSRGKNVRADAAAERTYRCPGWRQDAKGWSSEPKVMGGEGRLRGARHVEPGKGALRARRARDAQRGKEVVWLAF